MIFAMLAALATGFYLVSKSEGPTGGGNTSGVRFAGPRRTIRRDGGV